jgi:hypothetical protein
MPGSSPSRCVSAARPAPDRWATEANKPGTPARARSSRKPLRRECRMFRPYLTTCGRSFFEPTRPAGAVERPAFPAPSYIPRARESCITRTHRRRGNA